MAKTITAYIFEIGGYFCKGGKNPVLRKPLVCVKLLS